jgi:MerR family transcriptional regulator, copper efflux regulator
MKIGEMARRAEVTIDTVRFYERRGVLPPPDRLPSGYRVYDTAAVERVRFARELQGLGFTLDEVVDALHTYDAGDPTCADQRWRLERALDRIDQRIAELRQTRAEVMAVLDDCTHGHCRFEERRAIPLANA